MKKNTDIFSIKTDERSGFFSRCAKELRKNYALFLMFLPVFLYYLIFAYKPMYGALMAFQNYSPAKGMMGSPWVGFKHFKDFFSSFYFGRLMLNTIKISLYSIVFGFPAPIILALLINEVRNRKFKSVVQSISYLPHFISLVVICGMIKKFTMDTGIVNDIVAFFGGARKTLLNDPASFVPLYTATDIWQEVGWNSIIYMAALAGIDQQLYEAAMIDGAGRLRQTWHITLPGLIPTIMIMLILRMGSALSVGYEKIILLYNPTTMKTADVISSYVYRKGLQERSYSFASAVGLFNSVINFMFLIVTNILSKRLTEQALW